MKFISGDRQKIARWIDNQFERNDTFPSKCIQQKQSAEDKVAISPQHVQAYREWTRTPATDDALTGWIDQWLNEQDQQSLMKGIRNEIA